MKTNAVFDSHGAMQQSRAQLKAELHESIAKGDEEDVLRLHTTRLRGLQQRLEALQKKRARVRREMTIRERKLRDRKGKVPRMHPGDSPQQAREDVADSGVMNGTMVGCVAADGGSLVVHTAFRRALSDVHGFQKLWLVLMAPAHSLVLSLVHVVACDTAAGTVVFDSADAISDAAVLDIKPYLPYCEAWPASTAETAASSTATGVEGEAEADTAGAESELN